MILLLVVHLTSILIFLMITIHLMITMREYINLSDKEDWNIFSLTIHFLILTLIKNYIYIKQGIFKAKLLSQLPMFIKVKKFLSSKFTLVSSIQQTHPFTNKEVTIGSILNLDKVFHIIQIIHMITTQHTTKIIIIHPSS